MLRFAIWEALSLELVFGIRVPWKFRVIPSRSPGLLWRLPLNGFNSSQINSKTSIPNGVQRAGGSGPERKDPVARTRAAAARINRKGMTYPYATFRLIQRERRCDGRV